jgi:hypothetical protein
MIDAGDASVKRIEERGQGLGDRAQGQGFVALLRVFFRRNNQITENAH